MTDNDLYRKLSALTKRKEEWKESIPHVASMLENQPLKITGKALWLLGEMGMNYPEEILPVVSQISLFLDSREALLRERALNALGRIGRSNYETVRPYWNQMMRLVTNNVPQVRLAFIWASENIATNTPDAYEQSLPVFAELLHDRDEWVRMEAPEMFRVMGKRRPGMVRPYLEILQSLAENDPNPVVRIHSAGAIRITNKELNGY